MVSGDGFGNGDRGNSEGGTRVVKGRRFRVRATSWTVERRRVFLDALAATANVTWSAAAAGMSRAGASQLRKRDGTFARLWAEALDQGRVRLEEELLACALGHGPEGDNPSGDRGEPPARRPFDPDLALRVLNYHARGATPGRARAPAGPAMTQEEVDALLMERLEAAAKRLEGR